MARLYEDDDFFVEQSLLGGWRIFSRTTGATLVPDRAAKTNMGLAWIKVRRHKDTAKVINRAAEDFLFRWFATATCLPASAQGVAFRDMRPDLMATMARSEGAQQVVLRLRSKISPIKSPPLPRDLVYVCDKFSLEDFGHGLEIFDERNKTTRKLEPTENIQLAQLIVALDEVASAGAETGKQTPHMREFALDLLFRWFCEAVSGDQRLKSIVAKPMGAAITAYKYAIDHA